MNMKEPVSYDMGSFFVHVFIRRLGRASMITRIEVKLDLRHPAKAKGFD
ncbi:hypothetical protein [Peribacillus frigoritolerans]|nr:hypothetical protein [Peribacillus frigoritolerans]MEE3953673.1 hypothetical protein [Peribacillus frigoritolerans]